jgi:hypothetical protein
MKRKSAHHRVVYAPPQYIETRRELESKRGERGSGKREEGIYHGMVREYVSSVRVFTLKKVVGEGCESCD